MKPANSCSESSPRCRPTPMASGAALHRQLGREPLPRLATPSPVAHRPSKNTILPLIQPETQCPTLDKNPGGGLSEPRTLLGDDNWRPVERVPQAYGSFRSSRPATRHRGLKPDLSGFLKLQEAIHLPRQRPCSEQDRRTGGHEGSSGLYTVRASRAAVDG